MASERFLNLPEEKKQRIIAAARDELSRVPYDALSINRIIKEAGIPRGSFYDYFADKDDLIEYLMGDYCRMMERMLDEMFRMGSLDVFAAARRAVACTVAFSMEEGREALCRNLFSCMRMNRRFSFEQMMDTERALVTSGLPYIDREHFRDGRFPSCSTCWWCLHATPLRAFLQIRKTGRHTSRSLTGSLR